LWPTAAGLLGRGAGRGGAGGRADRRLAALGSREAAGAGSGKREWSDSKLTGRRPRGGGEQPVGDGDTNLMAYHSSIGNTQRIRRVKVTGEGQGRRNTDAKSGCPDLEIWKPLGGRGARPGAVGSTEQGSGALTLGAWAGEA